MTVDDQMIETARAQLYAAVLSDVLDGLGYRHQVLPARIRPLDEALVLVGRARTGLYRDVYHVPRGHNPYELEIALIDDLKPGEVAVLGLRRVRPDRALGRAADHREPGARRHRLRHRRPGARRQGDPGAAASRSSTAASARWIRRAAARSAAIDVPIECAGVTVNPGDLVFGDADGVLVVPQPIVRQALKLALAKVEGEDRTREELRAGRPARRGVQEVRRALSRALAQPGSDHDRARHHAGLSGRAPAS